ncbi:hypothetical protein MNB_SUP05-SYMBIONT-7-443 [hydrothermal vent metagenome]|uniref:Uncharacterized protein n=1 Tax=hydrothermal vent metagenome TaxID=652676 RepID=A0A1W1E2F1_9ZZZZ
MVCPNPKIEKIIFFPTKKPPEKPFSNQQPLISTNNQPINKTPHPFKQLSIDFSDF